jgi:general secretion pathway protein K
VRIRKNGFALLVVIWGIGLISLLILSFVSNSHSRLLTAYNRVYSEKASLILDGIINITSARMLNDSLSTAASNTQLDYYHNSKTCSFDEAAIAITISSETGKVDLNLASRDLLIRVFTGLALNKKVAEQISDNIIDYRTDKSGLSIILPANQKKPFSPKHSIFESVMELDQVEGIDQDLFKKIISLFTVHSRNAGIDPSKAPPILFAILIGEKIDVIDQLLNNPNSIAFDRNDSRFPNQFKSTGNSLAYFIHAEAVLPTKQSSARDAIIEINLDLGKIYSIKEIRRGRTFYYDELLQLSLNNNTGIISCM